MSNLSNKEYGTWNYRSGDQGSVTVPSHARVTGITALALAGAASFTIDGGDSIPVSAGGSVNVVPQGNLEGPVEIVFTGTSTFFVEYVI